MEQLQVLEVGNTKYIWRTTSHLETKVETTGLQYTGTRILEAAEPNAGPSICQEISASHCKNK